MIYLDNAATSFLKPPSVSYAVMRAMQTASSPGRGAYRTAMRAADLVLDCREEAAALFHMDDPSRVVLTGSATHGLNLAIRSLARPGMRVLVSGFEHNAVMRPLRALGADVCVAGRTLFDADLVFNEFQKKIEDAKLVVCTHVSNVFGFILPIERIAALCRSRGVPLIVDASQSAGVLDFDFPALGAAFAAMPGHKALYGPQGTGLLLCAQEGSPLLFGGSGADSASPFMPQQLPERLEAGTCNVPGAAGLCAGLRFVREKTTEKLLSHERSLLRLARERLADAKGVRVFAGAEEQQTGILSLLFENTDCESAARLLDEEEIAVRSGLHCAPAAHESAGTFRTGTLRMSFSAFVGEKEVEKACDVIRSIF